MSHAARPDRKLARRWQTVAMSSGAPAGLDRAIPARTSRTAAADYRARFGFTALHETDGFAVLVRDAAVLHLWAATDESWRSREDLAERPICSGAESFLAGTASCRIEVAQIDALFDELQRAGTLHPTVRRVAATDFGTREFATLDVDGNLLTFFRRETA